MALDTARTVATLRGLTAKFDTAMAESNPIYPTMCTLVKSNGADEKYGFLGKMPTMREWLGDRVFQTLRGADYALKNKKWESSLLIEKDDIDDDSLGMYDMALQELGEEATHRPDKLLFDVLQDGEDSECFDGQNFFDTDHSWGDSGTQSNDLTADAADPDDVTEAEFRAAYSAARSAMVTFKRDNGEPWIRPVIGPQPGLLLIVHPDLQQVAEAALFKQFITNGESNVIVDRPERILPGSYLTNKRKFYLLNISQRLKPFVFQARKPLQRQMKGLNDHEFKDVKFMTDARYNLGYLAWWNAVLTTFTQA